MAEMIISGELQKLTPEQLQKVLEKATGIEWSLVRGEFESFYDSRTSASTLAKIVSGRYRERFESGALTEKDFDSETGASEFLMEFNIDIYDQELTKWCNKISHYIPLNGQYYKREELEDAILFATTDSNAIKFLFEDKEEIKAPSLNPADWLFAIDQAGKYSFVQRTVWDNYKQVLPPTQGLLDYLEHIGFKGTKEDKQMLTDKGFSYSLMVQMSLESTK